MRNPGQQYCQDANGRLQMVGIRLAAANGSANGSGNSSGCVNNGDPLNLSFSYGSAGSNNGNLISETLLPLNNTQTFTYDAYNRLSTAKEGSTNWSQTYKYDVNGNANTSLGNRYVSATSGLSLLPSSFTPTANTNFNSSNQLIIQGSTYDRAGNLKTMGAYNLTYDAENRQVTNTVSGANTYSYDGEGRRIQKATTSPAVTTVYVYDAKGETVAEYASAPSGQLETTYLTTDHLGSTRLATTADGTVLGYHDYLPFGEEIPATIGGRSGLYGSAGDAVTHKFTGQERDAETASSAMQGLDYFGARYFSAAQGRFTSPDPLWVTADRMIDPQRLNLYAYGRNNPLKYSDPTGTDVVLGNCASNMTISMCQAAVTSGLSKEDRSHTRWVKGDGTNGFKKGQWGLQVDSDYKSSSKNFANLQTAANSHDGTAAVNIVAPHTEIPTTVGTMQNGRATAVPFQQYMASQGVNAAFNYVSGADEAFGQTLFPLIGQPTADTLYAPGRDTQMYLAADDPGAELTKTFFHELVHIVLGDFGRTVPKSGHDVPGVTKLTNAAEAEAQKNYGH